MRPNVPVLWSAEAGGSERPQGVAELGGDRDGGERLAFATQAGDLLLPPSD
jgi:hypothetical protein